MELFGLELGAWREMGLGLVVLTEKRAGARQQKLKSERESRVSVKAEGGR